MTSTTASFMPYVGKARRPWRFRFGVVAQHTILIILLGLAMFPLAIMVSMSFRPTVLIYADFWGLPTRPVLENYSAALVNMLPPLGNTLIVSFASIFGILVTALPTAYAFARMNFPGKQALYILILALLTVPSVLLLVPHFILASQLGLRFSLLGLIVFYIAGGQAFAIFLLTTFLRAQPLEMFEAARVDGAKEWQAMLFIALPLAMPILVTIAIMNFLSFYGDFIWPSLMLRGDQLTLLVALEQYNPVSGQFGSRPDLGAQAAGYTFSVVPQLLIFVFGMKYFVQGLTSGSIKA